MDELASSMGTVIPVANASNFSIEELSASYAQLTKNGVATAESGTYLKAMLSELSKSGSIADITLRELTGKGFADLKKEGMSTTEILSLLNVEAQKNDKTLKDMFGSVEAGSAALVLYKNNGEEYNEMLHTVTLRLYFEDGGTVHYAYELNGQETLLDGSFPAAKSTWSGAKPALFARNTANRAGGQGRFGAVSFECL